MLYKIRSFVLLLVVFSCVEPYEFVVEENQNTIVVEAMISDKSFNETLEYPTDGRYFSAKLTYTGDVTNERPEGISGAHVELMSSENESWVYTETGPGAYTLLDVDFKALPGVRYKLVVVHREDLYESSWEELPATAVPPMGDVGFVETEKQVYVVESGENVVRTKQGINVFVPLPPHGSDPIYYRWDYTPTWIYRAPLASSAGPYYTCWATNENYLKDYALQVDNFGGYQKSLFFIETIRNERLFEQFSLLVTQYAMKDAQYFFWKELRDQTESGAINDIPPFNIATNFVNKDQKRVSGYFGVSQEQARRWYFNIEDLSYHVEKTLRGDCLVVYGPGGPSDQCLDCREYLHGDATTVRPTWWTP
jgi:hypothetical protein